MKTINKIFMAIAVIILTPTVMLVAFILIADATDMDLKKIVWEEETETGTEFLVDGGPAETQPEAEASPAPEAPVPPEEQEGEQQPEVPDRLVSDPPLNWVSTGDNGALQQQLNRDAWNASPNSSASTNPSVSGNTNGNTSVPSTGLPDASAYLKAYLDVIFKNDYYAYVDYKIGTVEEAAELYEEELDVEAFNDIFGTLGFSDVDAAERMSLLKQIFASFRYRVGEAKKQADGSYIVTVSYEKMNVYAPAVDAYVKKAKSMITGWNREGEAGGETPSFESMSGQLIEAYTACLREAYGNATYEKEQNATIRLKVVNNSYEINEEDATKFGFAIVDSEAAMEKLEKAVKDLDF